MVVIACLAGLFSSRGGAEVPGASEDFLDAMHLGRIPF